MIAAWFVVIEYRLQMAVAPIRQGCAFTSSEQWISGVSPSLACPISSAQMADAARRNHNTVPSPLG
jgi:hypothetical protein